MPIIAAVSLNMTLSSSLKISNTEQGDGLYSIIHRVN